jgi:predicted DNA-binding transcriptional regulator AlpA
MVDEKETAPIEVPDGYDVLDATALAERLGVKRDTVLTYLSRRDFGRVPRPNKRLAMGPVWYEVAVREWESRKRGGGRG